MEDKIIKESIAFESKERTSLPAGATIIKKDVRTTVEEIENGFILKKNFDIKYTLGKNTDYLYYTKKVFSKENPIQIKEDKMLADYFE